MATPEDSGTVKSLGRGLEVLEGVAESDRPVQLSALARQLGMSKGGLFRILMTLVEHGYVVQDVSTSRYSVTEKLSKIGQLTANKMDLRAIVRPYLVRLRDVTEETVHLGVLAEGHMIYIDKLESNQALRMASGIGFRMPIHSTSLGKAHLAFVPAEQAEAIIRQLDLVPRTASTITKSAALINQLETIRTRGYSIDDEENHAGVRCVGAPILDRAGSVVACISVSGPSSRVNEVIVAANGTACHAIANEISLLVGGLTLEAAASRIG